MDDHRARIVYIVDDDDDVRDSTQVLLQCDGYEVEGFGSGREFLQHFDPTAGLCIILDLHMPDVSGLQVLDSLQAQGSTVPVILFSGRSDQATEAFSHRAGILAVLAKPIEPERMIALIAMLRTKQAVA